MLYNVHVTATVTASTARAVPFYFYFNEEQLENTGLMDCQAVRPKFHGVMFFFSLLKWKDSLFARWPKRTNSFQFSLFTSTFPMYNPSWTYGGAVAALLRSVQVFCLCELPFGFTTLAQEMNSRSRMRDCVCLIGLCGNFVYICVSSLEHLRWQGKVRLLLRKQICVRSALSPQTSIFLRNTRLCESGTCS